MIKIKPFPKSKYVQMIQLTYFLMHHLVTMSKIIIHHQKTNNTLLMTSLIRLQYHRLKKYSHQLMRGKQAVFRSITLITFKFQLIPKLILLKI